MVSASGFDPEYVVPITTLPAKDVFFIKSSFL